MKRFALGAMPQPSTLVNSLVLCSVSATHFPQHGYWKAKVVGHPHNDASVALVLFHNTFAERPFASEVECVEDAMTVLFGHDFYEATEDAFESILSKYCSAKDIDPRIMERAVVVGFGCLVQCEDCKKVYEADECEFDITEWLDVAEAGNIMPHGRCDCVDQGFCYRWEPNPERMVAVDNVMIAFGVELGTYLNVSEHGCDELQKVLNDAMGTALLLGGAR